MSTSQAREIHMNNKELTILRLRRVSRKYLVYVYYSGS